MKSHYEVLGLKKDCSTDEVRRAYRRLAKLWHPDVNKSPEAQARFIELHEAYVILSHVEKRRIYDSVRLYNEQRAGFQGESEEQSCDYNWDDIPKSGSSAYKAANDYDNKKGSTDDWLRYMEFVREAGKESEKIIKKSLESSLVGVFSWLEEYGRILLVVIMVVYLVIVLIAFG